MANHFVAWLLHDELWGGERRELTFQSWAEVFIFALHFHGKAFAAKMFYQTLIMLFLASCDMTVWVVRLIMLGAPQWLSAWCLTSIGVWIVGFSIQALFLDWSFEVRHDLLRYGVAVAIVNSYWLGLRLAFGRDRVALLLSHRLHKLGVAQVRTRSDAELKWDMFTNAHMGFAYVVTHSAGLTQIRGVWLLVSLVLVFKPAIERVVVLLRNRARRSVPYTLSYAPVHGSNEDVNDECGAHDVCGICLETLCASAKQLAAAPAAILRHRSPGLSACRVARRAAMASMSHLASRRGDAHGADPFPALSRMPAAPVGVGISAARFSTLCSVDGHHLSTTNWGTERHLATLRCGHVFHPHCLGLVATHRKQCPTCRMGWDGHPDEAAEVSVVELVHVVLGLAIMTGYFYASIPSSYFFAFVMLTFVSAVGGFSVQRANAAVAA
mmetsp:Transcript_73308/g.203350  ORF Transcript_73308/g.203350 Transcript_73308/m.203350 type:complete len:439 (-) Transcript_73308:27-1343(-)